MVNHMRHTRSQTAQRRSHHALTAARITLCEKCGSAMLMHRACKNCGWYRKHEVINTGKKLDKKTKTAKKAAAPETK